MLWRKPSPGVLMTGYSALAGQANRQAGSRQQLQESWLQMSAEAKHPYEKEAAWKLGLLQKMQGLLQQLQMQQQGADVSPGCGATVQQVKYSQDSQQQYVQYSVQQRQEIYGQQLCAGQGQVPAQTVTSQQPIEHIYEDKEERLQYWRQFWARLCTREKVELKCILDFPYADYGPDGRGLNLSGDNRLLERLYCFEDHEDATHQLFGGERRRVILKVHTFRKWGDRGDDLYKRTTTVTGVKVLFSCATAAARAVGASRAEREDCKRALPGRLHRRCHRRAASFVVSFCCRHCK